MHVLVVNAGSTSLKVDLFDMPAERYLVSASADRIGEAESALKLIWFGAQEDLVERKAACEDHRAALAAILTPILNDSKRTVGIAAVGHRVVHGGEKLVEATRIDDTIEAAIEQAAAYAPLHNPPNLQGIRACRRLLPDVPQVAVLDTAFHRTLAPEAFLYGLPYELYGDHGVRRYGFHGTSHRYVATETARLLGRSLESLKLITCHLGGGCSVCAIDGGRSIDTSMGMTPLEGLLMATRCGDLDPAVVPFLQQRLGMNVQEIDAYLSRECGLKGVSGIGSDMRDLLAREAAGEPRPALAVAMFCRRVRKYIGAYLALLGGLDALVFTAGIGENSAPIRARILAGLEPIGLRLDPVRNEAISRAARVISAAGEETSIVVVPTDEELQIARETHQVVGAAGTGE